MVGRKAEIDAIVVVARKRNASAQITGGLFVTRDIVAQLLEGPIDATEHIYAKICADPRHDNVTLLRRREAPRRIFPTWAMGFAITADATDEISGIFAQAFAAQNDAVADAVTDLIKNSTVRLEM